MRMAVIRALFLLWLSRPVGFILSIATIIGLAIKWGRLPRGVWWVVAIILIVQHFARPIAQAYHLTLGPDHRTTISWNLLWVTSRLGLTAGAIGVFFV